MQTRLQDNANPPVKYNPAAYPPIGHYTGKTKMPDFKGRDKAFNLYRTRIRNGLKGGPNFSNHFSLIQFGCGTGCLTVIVSDSNTGQPVEFPRSGEEYMYLSLKFHKDSRLVAAQWASYGQQACYIELFDFRGDSWKLLNKKRIGEMAVCDEDIERNLIN